MCGDVKVPSRAKSLFCRVFNIFFYSDLHGVRVLLAFSELLWAFTLIFWDGVFNRPTYTQMAKVMGEHAWGLVFAVSGITQLIILLSGKYNDRMGIVFAGWNSVLWWFVVVSMYLSVSPPAAAISGECGLAVGALWVFVRSGVGPVGRRAGDDGRQGTS